MEAGKQHITNDSASIAGAVATFLGYRKRLLHTATIPHAPPLPQMHPPHFRPQHALRAMRRSVLQRHMRME
jgi:hypothetical protein